MIVYYAHCQALYGTPQASRDIKLLESLGFTLVNPERFDQTLINEMKAKGEDVMAWFCNRVKQCDALAFRSLPDGRIPIGIAKEISAAQEVGMPVFELPSGVVSRRMNIDETLEYLHEVGQR